jgi:hypothetical protein
LAGTTSDVQRAKLELGRMKTALKSWLAYRQRNDLVLAGSAPEGRKLRPGAKLLVAAARDPSLEQKLATQIHTLLSEVMPDAKLPNPDVRANPHAAVELAQIVTGDRVVQTGLAGIGIASVGHIPWLPLAIVGGVLLAITTAIKSQADLAAEKERIACIQAGACTDYGFWLKWGAIATVGYLAWTKWGLRERVQRAMKK